MTPYYSEDGITIYHGDCREIVPALSRDLAIVSDPPYGISYRPSYGQRRGAMNSAPSQMPPVRGDDEPFDPAWLLGHDEVLLWGAEHYAQRLPVGRWLVWDKRCDIVPSRTQGDCEFAWVKAGGQSRVFRHLWDGMLKATERGEPRQHPTQKPIALMAWCLGFVGNSRTVLDPYMGSGTTLRAAKDVNRSAIGVEIEERYCEIAAKRLSQRVLQLEMA